MRLPPLNALRAFEAAARHGGYIAAADELNVTRGAVSRHVKLLEEHLGVALFRRGTRGVTLTEAGRRLLPVLSDAFAQIGRETARLSAAAHDLRILCPPATSIRWLIPRLDRFRARHPDIRVRLTTDFYGETGFDTMSYDVAFSVENWPRGEADLDIVSLFPVRLTPACSPELRPRLRTPEDLRTVTLLHETRRRTDWSDWLSEFPVQGVDALGGGEDFPNLDMATRAAVMGAGVVMADLVLCADELASGTLVAPFPDRICVSPLGGVCLLVPQARADDPKVRAFRDWAEEMAPGPGGGWRPEPNPAVAEPGAPPGPGR